MAKGVVTITTASPTHVQRGSVLTWGSGNHFYVIGQKSPTELIGASSWRESLWVPWFILKARLRGLWETFSFWVWLQWNKIHGEKVPPDYDSNIFVANREPELADDSEPELEKPPRYLN